MRIQCISVLAAIAAGCASPSHPGDPGNITTGIQVQTGREFEIAAGQEAQVQGTAVTVRFVGVGEDSRCPVDVQCVWAGDAVVRLTFAASGAPSAEAALHTTLDPKSASFEGYSVRLTGLRPAPRSGTTIPPASYVATLEIRPL